jgi:5-formyltetrahydrofolate cyclo-ligase
MELNKQEEKKLLRKEIKSIKSNYSENEFLLKSEIIFNSFENLIFSTKYSHIMAYW